MKFNWLFEYGFDWDIYNGEFPFSEKFIEKYLRQENKGTYLCLHDKDTEESLKMVGNKGKYIFEGDLIIKNESIVHFVLAKKIKSLESTIINDLPVSGEKLTFPMNEIFNEKEVIYIFKNFHNNKTIESDLEILRKRYMF